MSRIGLGWAVGATLANIVDRIMSAFDGRSDMLGVIPI